MGISGASGAEIGIQLLQAMQRQPEWETHLVISEGARRTIRLETAYSVEQVEALRVATATSGRNTEIVRYPDAEHGFHCDARPAVFNAPDATDAHRRTLEFFAAHLHDR